MINPDGVVCGNYRSNLQGKDMNRHFYADDDKDAKERVYEVELLRSHLKKIYRPAQPDKFKLFLDIHAHSIGHSAFIYAPEPESEEDKLKVRRLPMILANASPYFSFDNCKFSNDRFKRNCARLSCFRDFNIAESYTLELSCFGYEVKGSGGPTYSPDIE